MGRPADGEIVVGHLGKWRNVRNVRGPAVALSIETNECNAMGPDEYLVVNGTARITAGGGPALLRRLAHRYFGPMWCSRRWTTHPLAARTIAAS